MRLYIRALALISLVLLPACDFFQLRQIYREKANIPTSAPQTCQLGQFQIPEGILDNNFNGTGFLTGDYFNGDARLVSAVLTAECNIIAAVIHSWVPDWGYGLIKVKLNGEVDTTFGDNGIKMMEAGKCTPGVGLMGVNLLAIQEEKIIFSYCVQDNMITRRLNLDGSYDKTFGDTGVAKLKIQNEITIPQSVAIQPDGKILITGHVGNTNYSAKQFLIRYDADGVLDPTFLNGALTIRSNTRNIGKALVLDKEGNIYVQGSSELNGDFTVTKYFSTGLVDAYYGKDGVATVDVGSQDLASGIQITPDNKIVVAGVADTNTYAAFRLLPDGNLDPTFGDQGIATYDSYIGNLYNYYGLSRFVLQENGDIILSAFSANLAMTMIRLDENGSLQPFNGAKEWIWNFGYATGYANILVPLPDGRLFAGTGLGSGADYKALFYLIK